jgi:hypothetical protein
MTVWTAKFWKQTVERAIKTAAQAALAFFVVGSTVFDQIDWAAVAGGTAIAAIASVLTSLASAPFGPEDSPSLVGDE